MAANDYDCEIAPKKEGRRNFGATPKCKRWPDFPDGTLYYCQPGLWPERCAEGRRDGPVAPDGHPGRVACEKQFLQLRCPYFSFSSDEHMSYDPWYVINGENQNHPRNVRVCGQGQFESHESWRREPYQGRNYIVAGQWSIASAHGNGNVCAEAANGVAKKCVRFVEP